MQGVVLPDARSGAAAHNIESKLEIERRDEQKILLHHRALHAVGQFVGTPYFFVVACGYGLTLRNRIGDLTNIPSPALAGPRP